MVSKSCDYAAGVERGLPLGAMGKRSLPVGNPRRSRKRTGKQVCPCQPTFCILAICGCVLSFVAACREPPGSGRRVGSTHDTTLPASADGESRTSGSPRGPKPAARPVSIPVDVDDPDRWLLVEKAREGAPGAWATGSFDRKRNKLDIRTRDVRQFALDVSRIPINWERLVVIGIDGVNSELRKRDYSVLHFRLNDHGEWVILE